MSVRVRQLDGIIRKYLDAGTDTGSDRLQVNTISERFDKMNGGTGQAEIRKGDLIDNAIAALNENRNEEAVRLFDAAIAGLHYPRAVALARMKKWAEAAEALKILLASNSSHEKAQALLAEIEKALNDSGSLPNAEQPEVKTDSVSDTGIRCETIPVNVDEPAQNARRIFEDAKNALLLGNRTLAFRLLCEAKAMHRPVEELDLTRAKFFFDVHSYGNAREAVLEELRHFPECPGAKELLGEIDKRDVRAMTPSVGDADFKDIYGKIRPYTMLSEQRLYSLFCRAREICQKNTGGNFVECGVAGGGSSALLAWTIAKYTKQPRFLFSFDSFEGMPEPTEKDCVGGMTANETGWGTGTCSAPEESIRKICGELNVLQIVKIVKGRFEQTLPKWRLKCGMIAMLHLDGDWYESTKAILENLYDTVSSGGVLQVDDYGHWEGCRTAVNEFAAARNLSFAIQQIDGTGVWFYRPDSFPVNKTVTARNKQEFELVDPCGAGIQSEMSVNERFQLFYALKEIVPVKSNPVRFIEIGSFAGASLFLTWMTMKLRRVQFAGYAIEPAGTPQLYVVLEKTAGVRHLKMFSHDAAPLLSREFGGDGNAAQFIFIDGDHFYDGIRRDIINFYPLCAPGGIMVFHDWLPVLTEENREYILSHHAGKEPGVRRACEELMEKEYGCELVELPLLYPADPTQTQAYLPVIPGVFSTVRAYRKPGK
jgi:predicted O-methyltransferase YrrM